MPISDWLDMMPETVQLARSLGTDAFGKPSYGPNVAYRARVVYKTRRVISRVTGDDAIITATVWLNAAIELNIDDQITLPDGKIPGIANWELVSDENGPHHTKVYLA